MVLVDELRANGPQPDSACINAALGACSRASAYVPALHLLREMPEATLPHRVLGIVCAPCLLPSFPILPAAARTVFSDISSCSGVQQPFLLKLLCLVVERQSLTRPATLLWKRGVMEVRQHGSSPQGGPRQLCRWLVRRVRAVAILVGNAVDDGVTKCTCGLRQATSSHGHRGSSSAPSMDRAQEALVCAELFDGPHACGSDIS